MKTARVEEPLMQLPAALSQRIFEALLRPGAEPVERDRKPPARAFIMLDILLVLVPSRT